MTQTAQVKTILSNGRAEVAVVRQGACSHNCSDCGGCMTAQQPIVTAQAINGPGAREGELVVVESATSRLLGIAAVVYIVPLILLIVGYAAGQGMGFSENGSVLTAGLCFLLSLGIVWLLNRWVKRKNAVQFNIISIQGR